MDLKNPINIEQVNAAVVKHKDVLVALDMFDVKDVLEACTPMPGVTDSITLGRVEGGKISRQYTGKFKGEENLGKVVPRTLIVRPVVAEMADEPERYRRAFIADVMGGLWDKKHPFELWLVQHGIKLSSQDLHNCMFTAKYNAASTENPIEDAFDGFGTILDTEKTAGNISAEKNNLFVTGALSGADIGEKLLDMWRSRPQTFRNKTSTLWISESKGDDYDDWLESETIQLPGTDESRISYLKKTNKRVQIKRTSAIPADSNFALLTTRGNMFYGFDKLSDMKDMRPFHSGNPYLFTAAMKYVFGCQFASIHESELCMNDQLVVPAP